MTYYQLKLKKFKTNNIKAQLIIQMVKTVSEECCKKKRMWVRSFISKYGENGHFENVYNEWRYNDPYMYRMMLRITPEMFEILLGLVEHRITKQTTHLRNPIPADKRLSITLRYLATGKNVTMSL